MRRKAPHLVALAVMLVLSVLVVFFVLSGGLPQTPANNTTPPANATNITPPLINSTTPPTGNNTSPPATNTTQSPQPYNTIRIANFNIQVFGESKRSKPEVMEVLAKTARNFDLMAVQELRDDTETTLPIYLEKINSLPGPEYAAISSPRLGRTSSKENYAFVYDTSAIRLVPGSNYTFADPPPGTETDLFQREPFLARFEAVTGDFDFVLITIHTDPDETPQELSDMALVVEDAKTHFPDEKDFIILGDLNADCTYLSAAKASALEIRNSTFTWAVPDEADTTTKTTNCAYDRIIFGADTQENYAGEWGVFRFDQEYTLNQTFTEQVSDHYPVFADFKVSGDSD
ncbi:MAG: endonuclease/exonuclease/phosphatase family protein [Candidatus Micrarchaeota archaeon]